MNPHIKLINGNCIEVLKRVPDRRVDLVVTDPPYLVNYRDQSGRRIRNDRAADWLAPAFREVARVLKPNSSCISFYGWSKVHLFMEAWLAAGLYPVEHLVFAKPYASSGRYAQRTHECAYILAKGRPAPPQALLKDVLPWKYSGNRLHPTQKPVEAMEALIAAFSRPGDIVLDPFMGSGTTGVAACKLGRHFLGIELDPGYYRVATKRFITL
jgi:adenine-specific DNA-methyltransferase